jgi:hypothetical protein
MNFAAADYPHRCLRCGSAAYDSGFSVKCTSQVCPNLDPVLGGKTSSPILVWTQPGDLNRKGYPVGSVLDAIKSMNHMDVLESINKSMMDRMEQSFVKPVSPSVLDTFNKLTFGKSRIVLGLDQDTLPPTFEEFYYGALNHPKGGKSYIGGDLTISRADLEMSDELPGGVLRNYVEDLYRHAVPRGAEVMKVSSRIDGSSIHIDVTMRLNHPMPLPHMPITWMESPPDPDEVAITLAKARDPRPGGGILVKNCLDPKLNGIYQAAAPWDGSTPGQDAPFITADPDGPKLPDIDEGFPTFNAGDITADVADIDDLLKEDARDSDDLDDDDPDAGYSELYGGEDQDDDVSLD